MMPSATKSERNRLDWSAQWGADPSENRINQASEARNRARFARQLLVRTQGRPKGLIGAQNGGIIEPKAFYLGNVG